MSELDDSSRATERYLGRGAEEAHSRNRSPKRTVAPNSNFNFFFQLKPSERPVIVTEACRLISALLRRSPAFPDASRHFSSIAPNLLTSLANCADISDAVPRYHCSSFHYPFPSPKFVAPDHSDQSSVTN